VPSLRQSLSFELNVTSNLSQTLHHFRLLRLLAFHKSLLSIMPSYEQFQLSGRTPLRVYNKQPSSRSCNVLAAWLLALTIWAAYETYKSPYGPA
jgi:hypothetical protein